MAVRGGVRLGVMRAGMAPASALAARSAAALDRPLVHPAELWVAVARDSAVLAGAFQRVAGATKDGPVFRRGSGGPAVRVAPGTVHVALSLARPDVLEPCDASRIVNRAVRPLLKALTKTSRLAHYFGRDWVSVAHRPAAWVGFAHDAGSGRTLFEAFVAVSAPFATADRASFLGKAPATLDEVCGAPVDPAALANAIVDSYVAKHAATEEALAPDDSADARRAIEGDDPPWTATVEEAIGALGAGPDARGIFRIGGDLLVSRDALARLEARVANAPDSDIGKIVDEAFTARGVAIEGVANLGSVRDVIVRARRPT